MDRDPLLPSEYAARILQIPPTRLKQWRWNNNYNIPYMKISNKCYYYLSDLEAFMKNPKDFKRKPKPEILRRGNCRIEAEPL